MPVKDPWRDSLRPRIEGAQAVLKESNIADLMRMCGGVRREKHLELSLFTTPYKVSLPDFVVTKADASACSEKTQILLLDYLVRGGNVWASSVSSQAAPARSRWIGFQELPDGAFYVAAFRSYTSEALLGGLAGDTARFCQAADHFGGEPLSLGDAAYTFRALPKISLAVVWWAGDGEFPANANVLFDRASAHALPVDGMAALGSLLCRGLLAAGEKDG